MTPEKASHSWFQLISLSLFLCLMFFSIFWTMWYKNSWEVLDTCIVRTCGSVVTISAAQPRKPAKDIVMTQRDRITQIFFPSSPLWVWAVALALTCQQSSFLLFQHFFFWFGFTIYMFLFLVKEIPNEERKADQRRFEMLNSCIPLVRASPYPNSVGIFSIEASLRDSRKVPTPPLE